MWAIRLDAWNTQACVNVADRSSQVWRYLRSDPVPQYDIHRLFFSTYTLLLLLLLLPLSWDPKLGRLSWDIELGPLSWDLESSTSTLLLLLLLCYFYIACFYLATTFYLLLRCDFYFYFHTSNFTST